MLSEKSHLIACARYRKFIRLQSSMKNNWFTHKIFCTIQTIPNNWYSTHESTDNGFNDCSQNENKSDSIRGKDEWH